MMQLHLLFSVRTAERLMAIARNPVLTKSDNLSLLRVRMRRMMLDMSQEKLGDALGLTFQQVQKYEKGTNRISASRLQHISHVLQVPVPFFFEGAPQVLGQPNEIGEAPLPAYVSDFIASSDGLALAKAFTRIKEPKLRRCIINLVEEITPRQI
jgi:transcriptional regulator with XRE-family HTH domain